MRISFGSESERKVLNLSVFHRNVMPGFRGSELLTNGAGDTLDGWRIIENGGDGWAISEHGFNGSKSFITSFAYCRKSQTIDLQRLRTKPNATKLFHMQVWYAGTGPNYGDKFYVKMQIQDAEHRVLSEFHSGEIIAEEKWKCLSHRMAYKDDEDRAAFLYYEDGGKDVEWWKGHFGTRISCASITADVDAVPSVSTYVTPRATPTTHGLLTNFNVGIGSMYSLRGVQAKSGPWYDMRQQDVLPTYVNCKRADVGCAHAINATITLRDAYLGGSSLHLAGAWPRVDNQPFTVLRLFRTDFLISNPETTIVSVTFLPKARGSVVYPVLIFDDGLSASIQSAENHTKLDNDRVVVAHDVQIESTGWVTVQSMLPAELGGRTVIEVQLCCESVGDDPIYDLCVGELKFYDVNARDNTCQVRNLTAELTWNSKSVDDGGKDVFDVNLRWDAIGEDPLHFRIFQNGRFIGRCACNMYHVANVEFVHGETAEVVFEVEPVSCALRVGQRCRVSCSL